MIGGGVLKDQFCGEISEISNLLLLLHSSVGTSQELFCCIEFFTEFFNPVAVMIGEVYELEAYDVSSQSSHALK